MIRLKNQNIFQPLELKTPQVKNQKIFQPLELKTPQVKNQNTLQPLELKTPQVKNQNTLQPLEFKTPQVKNQNILQSHTFKLGPQAIASQTTKFLQGHALLLVGPVSLGGQVLLGHKNMSDNFASWLLEKQNFETAIVATRNPQQHVRDFFEKLENPRTLGVLSYVGHGNQYRGTPKVATWTDGFHENWEFGQITDTQLTHLVSIIHETSCLVIVSDSCFSDGILDSDNPEFEKQPRKVIFISAAREGGPDLTRSAVYTADGGFMTSCLLDLLVNTKSVSYVDLMHILHTSSKYYNERNAKETSQLHLPRLYCYPESLQYLTAFSL